MRKTILPLLAITTTTLFGLFIAVVPPTAYADTVEQEIPFDVVSVRCVQAEDELVVYCAYIGAQEHEIDLGPENFPEKIEATATTTDATVEAEEETTSGVSIEVIESEPTTEQLEALKPEPIRIEGDTFIDEKHDLLVKLNECFYGVDAFARIQADERFIIPENWIDFDNTPLKTNVKLRDLVLAHEACEIMKGYDTKYLRQYRNMIIDELLMPYTTTDFSDSPYTVPVSQASLESEQEEAMRKANILGYITTDDKFSGDNRGGFDLERVSQDSPLLKQYRQYLAGFEEIPDEKPDKELDKLAIGKQYIDVLELTPEELRALADQLEKEKKQE